ncbi:hypothetical protein L226DRAFT_254601 [Lentinus tigrinus ALCF2SS1-7]|uniref:Uncharacterized protein n=1 Tax=Lentinus tigrinus ALCF2SS1-6 TaxID=1328759 RepID=A0A5C2RZI5_9APHY|nr:hypothetical protein L227DRAFT_252434 [Lentinus tigrinus ALCF2SS1-6]RPD79607.1 hypothetical protein L226DRAFT_254601 [Lentinus tigrinus ALCF2SS1-7]
MHAQSYVGSYQVGHIPSVRDRRITQLYSKAPFIRVTNTGRSATYVIVMGLSRTAYEMAKYSQICTITSRTNADNSEMDKRHPPMLAIRVTKRTSTSLQERGRKGERKGGKGRVQRSRVLDLRCKKATTADVRDDADGRDTGHRQIFA